MLGIAEKNDEVWPDSGQSSAVYLKAIKTSKTDEQKDKFRELLGKNALSVLHSFKKEYFDPTVRVVQKQKEEHEQPEKQFFLDPAVFPPYNNYDPTNRYLSPVKQRWEIEWLQKKVKFDGVYIKFNQLGKCAKMVYGYLCDKMFEKFILLEL